MATLTRIYGSLHNVQGSVITTGVITLQLQQDMVSVDGTKVAPFSVSHDLSTTAGVFEKYVYATVGASPGGLAYLVEYDPDPTDNRPAHQKDGYWRNYWAVPNTASVPLGNFVSASRGEPYANYMPLGGVLVDPELPDTIVLGLTPSGTSKIITANQTAGSNPALRYNGTSSYWDFSDDGASYRRMVGGSGTTGKITKWSAGGTIADSIISESGTIVTIVDTLSVPSLITNSGPLLLLPNTNVVFAKDLIPHSSLNFKLGSTSKKLSAIHAAELWIDTLVAQSSMSTIGGRFTVGPTTYLTSDLAAGATLGSFKHNQPDRGDFLYMEDSGLAEWLKVDSWDIVAVDTGGDWIEVSGDFTTTFTAGRTFVVRGSTGNNGTWTVLTSAYQAIPVRTRITVNGNITNATVDGWVSYLDAGPYVYRLQRNLEGGSDAWVSGDALLNTRTGFIDQYSVSGTLTGSGPTIVGNARTGTSYTDISPRWAIGNLDGLYGYGSVFGAAFGNPSGSWVKIDETNGVRLGHNLTTKVQIDTSGNAKFTDSVSAGTGDDIAILSGVDATYRIWIGNAAAASAPFRVSKTGAVTGTNVSFTAGGVTLDSNGLYIVPSSASGGGSYWNTMAVRWTTDSTYRTAIWRSDDSSGSLVKSFNIDNIASSPATIYNKTFITTNQQRVSPGTGNGVTQIVQWAKDNGQGETLVKSSGYDGTTVRDAYLWLWGFNGVGSTRALLAVGTAPGMTGSGGSAGTITSGVSVTAAGVAVTGPLSVDSAIYERGRTVPMGEFDTYTPTWTNLTVGNGTVTAQFAQVGQKVIVEITVVFGSTTAITGVVSVSLPVSNVAGTVQAWGLNYYFDSNIGTASFGAVSPASGTTVALLNLVNPATNVTATSPFTWAVNDQMWLRFEYKRA